MCCLLAVLFKTILVFALVLTAMRIMGKRQLGEMELSELVVALLISELGTAPIYGEVSLLWGVTAITALLLTELFISWLSMKSVKFRGFLIGRPSILIRDGRIMQQELRKNRFTLDELQEELRTQSFTDISRIKYAILETNGELTVLPYAAESPVTNRSLGLEAQDAGLPVLVVNDGRIMTENLRGLGYNEKWLEARLKEHGISGHRDVFIMTVDDGGAIYLERKR